MSRAKAIIPRKLAADPRLMAQVITNALNVQALAVKVDFEVTTQTWNDKPSFTIENSGPYTRTIGTNDAKYAMLNKGTHPHLITPKSGKVLRFQTPFQAKTVPNSISSGPGSKGGNEVYVRSVNHPGTKPRNWDKVIAKKWRRLFPQAMQRAIDAAVN